MVKRLRLHLGRIEDELRDVQRHFPAINAVLNCRRDDFSDTVRQNMLTAYEFLDAVVDQDLDLFSDEGLEALLQLNHLVLLGRGYDPRAFRRHISVTRRQFFDNFRRYVKPIRRWYRKHETENPYKVASEVYVGVLTLSCQLEAFACERKKHTAIVGLDRAINCRSPFLVFIRGSHNLDIFARPICRPKWCDVRIRGYDLVKCSFGP